MPVFDASCLGSYSGPLDALWRDSANGIDAALPLADFTDSNIAVFGGAVWESEESTAKTREAVQSSEKAPFVACNVKGYDSLPAYLTEQTRFHYKEGFQCNQPDGAIRAAAFGYVGEIGVIVESHSTADGAFVLYVSAAESLSDFESLKKLQEESAVPDTLCEMTVVSQA